MPAAADEAGEPPPTKFYELRDNLTPYPDDVNEAERRFLEAMGFEVACIEGLNLKTDREIGRLSLAQVECLALAVAQTRSDVIFLSCTNMPTLPLLNDLDDAVSRPVISSNSATIWDARRRLGVTPRPPRHTGRGSHGLTVDPLAARIEISRSALLHNVRSLRERLGPNRMIAAVLKGNAYGHGRHLVAELVADDVDLLAAADPADAIALAHLAPGKALSLGPAHGEIMAECIARAVQVTVSDQRQLDGLGPRARVHLLVDTGLHRLGVAPKDARALAHGVRASGAQIEAACCMVSRADFGEWDAVAEEVRLLRELPLGVERFHTGGSSVILERPDLAGDIGRPGLALLGYHPREQQRDLVDLQPSLRLIAPILELRSVAAGDSVGYQARRLDRETVVATLPMGVAHGLHPSTDARVVAEIGGTLCPFLCLPSLDYCLLDVTDAPNAHVGDEAVLLGGRPGSQTSVIDVANRLGVLIDHVLTPLSASLRRMAAP